MFPVWNRSATVGKVEPSLTFPHLSGMSAMSASLPKKVFPDVNPGLHLVVTIAVVTCLRSCSKEDFKAVNISTANISCEI